MKKVILLLLSACSIFLLALILPNGNWCGKTTLTVQSPTLVYGAAYLAEDLIGKTPSLFDDRCYEMRNGLFNLERNRQ